MVGEMTHCVICGQEATQGILLLGKTICPACEKKLLATSAKDEAYPGYLSRVKELWPPGAIQAALKELEGTLPEKRGETKD